MLRVVTCLGTQHDWRLVLLAAAVCFLTSVAAISLFHRGRETTGRTRVLWLVTTGAATGYGIWATHFIAMLAYSSGLPMGYDLLLTIFSLLAAAVTTGVGFALAATGAMRWAVPAGGALVGLGIAAMHYSGMWALEVPGRITWAPDLVAASIVLGVIFAMAALSAATRSSGARATLVAALLLTLAIVAHHFTAMGAVGIAPDPTVAMTPMSLSASALSVTIASAAAAVLGISLVAALAGRSRQQLIEESEAEIARQAERLQTALANMSQGLCMFDRDQRIVVANQRYAEMYGLKPDQLKPGTTLREVLEARIANGVYGPIEAKQFIEAGVASFHDEVREILHLSDGRFVSVLRLPMADGGLISTHEDITERQKAEARITHLAHHDVLTDLPNRALLRERLEQSIVAMRQGGRRLAVLMLDLDRFKEVNDTLGHSIGDALLKVLAQRLRACVRETDTIARLGGDEFAVVQRAQDPVADSVALATRILEVIGTPTDIEGHNLLVGTSIGIAVAPGDGDEPDQLLKNADLALYRAKSEGRGTYCFFEPEMDQRMQARRSLEKDLRIALAAGQFALHYQPLVNLQRDEICGFEALLRWSHPTRGNVPPAEFIPVAEESNLIVPIGEWVLRQACAEAARWPGHLKVAVNISPAQFKARNLADVVVGSLASAGIAPQRLELEVTESVMLKDEEAAFATLTRLHDLGVRIALDDFGTGYSSLSNLRKFPFDKIKIDRSFVSDLSVANVDALAVVRSIAQLGVSLGMATTAEGVETGDQLAHVRAEGCTEMQGYYICPPSPPEEIRRLINRECLKSAADAA
jgi:diguanylate cyclase (GGDEF)-like protein/PAS domain S-box-containing protein